MNVGTGLAVTLPPYCRCGVGKARCLLMRSGRGGAAVVVVGVTTRRRGPGEPRHRAKGGSVVVQEVLALCRVGQSGC